MLCQCRVRSLTRLYGCMVFDHVSEIVCVVAYGAMDPKPTSRLDVVRNKMVTRKIAEATLHDSLEFASYARPIVAFCWIRLVHGVPLTSYVCLLVSLSLSFFLSVSLSLSLVPPLFSVLLCCVVWTCVVFCVPFVYVVLCCVLQFGRVCC